jgi:hypothetical protein
MNFKELFPSVTLNILFISLFRPLIQLLVLLSRYIWFTKINVRWKE